MTQNGNVGVGAGPAWSGCRAALATTALAVLALSGCQPAPPAHAGPSSLQFQGSVVAGNGAQGTAGQKAVCQAGQAECADLATELACLADGSAWRQTACSAGQACEDGKCRPLVCQPGVKTCDGAQVVTCGARGVSVASRTACPTGTTCAGGTCVPQTCSPGASTCTGNAVSTCSATGTGWQVAPCASDESCAIDPATGAASCQTQVCAAGTVACKGGRVLACDAKGLHQAITADCVAAGQACVDGACVDYACEPGALGCDGVNVAQCKGIGTEWSISSCPTGQACSNGSCANIICVPGETYCDGAHVALCNATGTASDIQQACTAKEVCKQGACQVAKVLCGDGLCDGDEASSCPADCKPITITSPDFDKVVAGVPTGLPAAPRPLTSAPLPSWLAGKAMVLYANTLFVADTDNGNLVRVDKQTLQVQSTLAVGGRPEHLVVGPDGTAYVTSRDAGTVSVVPLGAETVASTWPVGAEPWGLAMPKSGGQLYVALTGEDAVVQLDLKTGAELARAPTASRPKALAFNPSGTLFVVHGGGFATAIAPENFAKKGGPVANTAKTVALRTANPVPACQDLTTKKTRVANRAVCLTVEPETGAIFVPHVLVASGSGPEVLLSVGVKPPEKPQEFVTVCSGGYGSTCSKVPVPPPPGEPACVGVPLRPYELSVSKLSPVGSLSATLPSLPIIDASSGRSYLTKWDQPVDAVMHTTATLMFVAAKGTNNVAVLNTAALDPMQWPVADIKVGDGPKALAVSANGKTLYVLNGNGFSVSEVDLTPLMEPIDNSASVVTDPQLLPKMAPLFMKASKTVSFAEDPLPAEAQLGRKVFTYANNSRLSVANRFACATCHLDGTEDKQVWFIAEGARQTPALAGRLADTAPYNWLGSKPTLADNITGTTARMGGSGLLPAEMDSLVQFLLVGLKAPPNPYLAATGLTAQQLKGKKIFMDPVVACATCHVPGSWTDGAQHDVGTMTAVEATVAESTGKKVPILYNTPSLRGLFYSAPYLHDGSAATIKEALKKTGTTMGKTAQLSEQELDDLVAYLQTL